TEDLLARLAAIPSLALIAAIRGRTRPLGNPPIRWHESIEVTRLPLPAARDAFLAVAGKKFGGDPVLDDLLTALDRVPLAITLLARQAEAEPDLGGLWQRWREERTRLLKEGKGTDRLTSIAVSFDLSITGPRMTDAARRLLAVLSLLPDG